MKYTVLIFAIGSLSWSSVEAGCFTRCFTRNNKVAPFEQPTLIKVHQRDISSDQTQAFSYELIQKAVYHLKLVEVRSIHLDSKKSVAFENISAKAKAIYLGLVAQRYNENLAEMEIIEEKIAASNEKFRRVIVAPKAHAFHLRRKKNKLPTVFVAPASLENTPEESKIAEDLPPFLFTTSSTEQSPKR